jgi:hypothetical protein
MRRESHFVYPYENTNFYKNTKKDKFCIFIYFCNLVGVTPK